MLLLFDHDPGLIQLIYYGPSSVLKPALLIKGLSGDLKPV